MMRPARALCLCAAGILAWSLAACQVPRKDDSLPGSEAPREWHQNVQFTSTEASPELASELGLTIAGLWSWVWPDEERAAGRLAGDVAFLLAAWGEVIEEAKADGFDLEQAASRDIFGNPAVPEWYVEDHGMPDTLTMSINSPIFFEYLKQRAMWSVDNLDFLLIDESLTHAGLIGLSERDAGFGPDDMRVYEEHLRDARGRTFREHLFAEHGFPRMSDAELVTIFAVASIDDFNIAAFLRKDAAGAGTTAEALTRAKGSVYDEYVEFHQVNAWARVNEYIDYVRDYAHQSGSSIKIAANTGLGEFADWTPLVSPLWRDRLDFTVSEMTPYNFEMLPNGKLLPSFKLARAISAGRPFGLLSVSFSTMLNEMMTTKNARLTRMNTIYFFEGLANRGNFALGWADDGPQTYIRSHDYAKPLIAFAKSHRALYDFTPARHRIGVLYGNEALIRDSGRFASYLGLSLGLAELGYQFDVLHTGDATFNELPIDEEVASSYDVILVPMANAFSPGQAAALKRLAERGVRLIFFDLGDAALAGVGINVAQDVGRVYANDRRPENLKPLKETISDLEPEVTGTPAGIVATLDRTADGRAEVIHLLNYNYNASDDTVAPVGPMTLGIEKLPDLAGQLIAIYVRPDGSSDELQLTAGEEWMGVTVPALDIYGALVIGQADRVREIAR